MIRKQRCDKKFFTENERNADLRLRVLRALGGKCARCGFSDWRALQVDHVDGFPEVRLRRDALYRDIRLSIHLGIKKYQCLCANCNQIKKYENNEHPNNKKISADLSSGDSVHSLNTNVN